MTMMVLRYRRNNEQHTCPGCPSCCSDLLGTTTSLNQTITHYRSPDEARQAGWARTDHPYFSEAGKLVWVCPECWKGLFHEDIE